MEISSITQKGQATIPANIRKALGIKTGDKIRFNIQKNGDVVLSKLTDSMLHLTVVEQCLAQEWLSPHDEEAFKDL